MLPREKFLSRGVDNLSDMELIAILIGRGIKGRDFMKVSRSLVVNIRKQLSRGDGVTVKSVSEVSGVGTVTAMKIIAGIELGRRLYDLHDNNGCFVKNSNDAFNVLKDIGVKKQEHIVCLFLNSRFELIQRRTICIGTLDGVSILPRDIIIPALELNASSVVMAHNHPSGDPTPSREDIVITKRISEGLELVGLNLLDHIVISKDEWSRVQASD